MNKIDAIGMKKVLFVYGLYRAIGTRQKLKNGSIIFKAKPIKIKYDQIVKGNFRVIDIKTGGKIIDHGSVLHVSLKGDVINLSYGLQFHGRCMS